jgi:hypothetical protein
VPCRGGQQKGFGRIEKRFDLGPVASFHGVRKDSEPLGCVGFCEVWYSVNNMDSELLGCVGFCEVWYSVDNMDSELLGCVGFCQVWYSVDNMFWNMVERIKLAPRL